MQWSEAVAEQSWQCMRYTCSS